MKVSRFVFLVLFLTGCAGSKYSSNPGAAVIGPGYLDAIADHPRDRDTQYYYPSFGIRNYQPSTEASAPVPKAPVSPAVVALLTSVPEPGPHVKEITGKGYPCLERRGIQLFTVRAQK